MPNNWVEFLAGAQMNNKVPLQAVGCCLQSGLKYMKITYMHTFKLNHIYNSEQNTNVCISSYFFVVKTADFPDEKQLCLIIGLPFPSKKALKDLNTHLSYIMGNFWVN